MRGIPSKNSNSPRGVATWSGVLTAANASAETSAEAASVCHTNCSALTESILAGNVNQPIELIAVPAQTQGRGGESGELDLDRGYGR